MSGSGCGSGSGAEVKETGDESEDYVLTGPVDLQPSAVESAASELEREVKIDTFVPEMNMSIATWQPRDTIYEQMKEELLLNNEERLATGSVTQVEVTPTIAMEWEDRHGYSDSAILLASLPFDTSRQIGLPLPDTGLVDNSLFSIGTGAVTETEIKDISVFNESMDTTTENLPERVQPEAPTTSGNLVNTLRIGERSNSMEHKEDPEPNAPATAQVNGENLIQQFESKVVINGEEDGEHSLNRWEDEGFFVGDSRKVWIRNGPPLTPLERETESIAFGKVIRGDLKECLSFEQLVKEAKEDLLLSDLEEVASVSAPVTSYPTDDQTNGNGRGSEQQTPNIISVLEVSDNESPPLVSQGEAEPPQKRRRLSPFADSAPSNPLDIQGVAQHSGVDKENTVLPLDMMDAEAHEQSVGSPMSFIHNGVVEESPPRLMKDIGSPQTPEENPQSPIHTIHQGSDYEELNGGDLDSDLEQYDPYFEAFETPRRKPLRIIDDVPPSSTFKSSASNLTISQINQLHRIYELMTDPNARKPYMSKHTRRFLSHLGDLNFQDYENELLHVDFSLKEIEQYRMYQAVPGRTRADCARFEEDYPDLIVDYDEPSLIQIEQPRPPMAASFTRQRLREEIGGSRIRADREVQKVFQLKKCSTFNHASGDVIDFKFSPVSNQFAACCNTLTNDYNRPGNLLFGDADKETVCALNGHADRTVGAERYYTVSDIRFSNDGKYLFSGSYDNTVKVWDMKRKQIGCLTGHGRITALSTTYCSDRVLAVASDDGNVYLYDVYNPTKQHRTILKSQNDRFQGAFLVPGEGYFSNWMLAGYEAKDSSPLGALYAYDIPTAKMIQRIVPGSNCQSAAYFHPSANYFVVGATGPFSNAGPSAKSVVRVFDPRTEKTTMEIAIDSSQKDINKVTMSPCGFRVTSSGTDGNTFVWDLRNIRALKEFAALHVLAHGRTKNVAQMEGQLEDWDTGVSVAEWLPLSDYILTGGSDGFLKLWDMRLGQPFVKDIAEFDSAVSSAAFNCDRDTLGVGESSGRVTFLNWHGTSDGELRKFYLEPETVEGTGDEGIRAARELLASGRVVIREHDGLRSVFGV